MKKISTWIANHSKLIVIIAILLLIPAAFGYFNTKVNYDILSYLPEDIKTVEGQNILTEKFGIGGFSFILTDLKEGKDLLRLEDKIKQVEGVNQVLSIADITDKTIPLEYLPNEVLEKVYKENETVIVVTFSYGMSDDKTMQAISNLRNIVEDTKVSGMSAMVVDTKEICESEMFAYILLAVLFCALVLFLATDSYLIPLFLLGNIGFSIIYNMGSNLLLGQISYITQAITAVLQLGVTMDFSIFLYHKYEQAKKIEKKKTVAMEKAIQETFQSIIGSSLTTIAGFLALCGMSLALGSDIGIVMAKGVICGLICVLTLFPALLLVFDKTLEKTKHNEILPKFQKIHQGIIRFHIPIIVVFLILIIPVVIGNNKVEVYYKLDESLPNDLPSRVANSDLADKFNLASPEIIIIDNEIKPDKVNQLIEEIKNLDGVEFVLSASEIEKAGIPLSILPKKLTDMFQNENYQLLLVNSTYAVASNELNHQISKTTEIVNKYDKNGIVAGEGALTKDLVEITNHDFTVVNYVSIGIIFILMIIVLKSFSLPLILVIVIEFAIFSNMAIAYYTNTTLPFIASIVIGTIQLGATIDYAILMSTTYLEERKKEKEKTKAMENTLSKTLPSILVSALCFFAATFGVSIYSKIDMIGSICDLLSRGAIISMFVVGLLLPTFLLIFDKLILKTTYGMKGSLK